MNNDKPLSYLTNRLSIAFIIVFMIISFIIVFIKTNHREIIISLLIAVSGAIGLFIITIASPNKQITWIDSLINRNKGN